MAAKSKAKKTATTKRSKSRRTKPSRSQDGKDSPCPIVGIGGSAGGFEAAMELLRHLPAKTGTALAVVQHLDPHHKSRLASLLGRATQMPVVEVGGTTVPEPNMVYVQPPNKCLIFKKGKLTLVRRTEVRNL